MEELVLLMQTDHCEKSTRFDTDQLLVGTSAIHRRQVACGESLGCYLRNLMFCRHVDER